MALEVEIINTRYGPKQVVYIKQCVLDTIRIQCFISFSANFSLVTVSTSKMCTSIITPKIVMDSNRQVILRQDYINVLVYGPGRILGTRTLLRGYPPWSITHISYQLCA